MKATAQIHICGNFAMSNGSCGRQKAGKSMHVAISSKLRKCMKECELQHRRYFVHANMHETVGFVRPREYDPCIHIAVPNRKSYLSQLL